MRIYDNSPTNYHDELASWFPSWYARVREMDALWYTWGKLLDQLQEDIKRALDEPVQRIVDAIRNALYNIPPELSADIRESGIQLTGGGALLDGLDKRLQRETGLTVSMSSHPQDDVAVGLGAAATNDRLLSALIRSSAAEASGE